MIGYMLHKFLIQLIPPILYAISYTLGGRDEAPLVRPRIWRRIIAPLLYSASLVILSLISNKFHVTYALSFPAYVGAMYITKYGGGDTLKEKIVGRIWSGLVVGIVGMVIAVFVKSYVLGVLQIALAVLAHLSLGIKNSFPEKYKAEIEEFTISFLTVCLVPFYA